jgi:hypothetical protein
MVSKSKHSPGKLPPNRVGLYAVSDPNIHVEDSLCDWFLDIVAHTEAGIACPPSYLLHKDVFLLDECTGLQEYALRELPNFEAAAHKGFSCLDPYFEHGENINKRAHKIKNCQIRTSDLVYGIVRRVALYKTLASLKPKMNETASMKPRRAAFGEIYKKPGSPNKN